MLVIVHISCKPNCDSNIHFPEGGYTYPDLTNKKDTDIFVYQLKDSFIYDYDGHYFFKGFNEPNLSLRYEGSCTFRFSYDDAFGGSSTVIRFNCHEMIIKTRVAGSLYPIMDENRLNETERHHYWILWRYFPINEQNFEGNRKRYYDSLVRLYPQLLSPQYFRYLKEKASAKDSLRFVYSTTTRKLTKEQYCYFANLLNTSGFWQLPHKVEFFPVPNDGDGFTVEANTLNKYKIVTVSNFPKDSLPISRFCTALVKFAGLENKLRWSLQ